MYLFIAVFIGSKFVLIDCIKYGFVGSFNVSFTIRMPSIFVFIISCVTVEDISGSIGLTVPGSLTVGLLADTLSRIYQSDRRICDHCYS
ncbi:hypothetical protein [Ureibacillus acetophenoni]